MIDLRSDTLTKPTSGMLRAMAKAPVGDDVFGEDPTVNRLEKRVAAMLDKQAALFVPSGTMSNQIGIRLHCGPGDEFLCEQDAHIFQYEQAAFAQLFGICAQTVRGEGGLLTPDALAPHVRPDDVHSPVTRLVCLENTHNRLGGRVLSLDGVAKTCAWAREQGLARHLDGARLWNACVATGASPSDWAKHFDTVSVCFSKGLGAPVGSALAGSAKRIQRARRLRKALGGGMRQAGVLAAAALHALDQHFERLEEDHAKAQLLAQAVRDRQGMTLLDDYCDTNIVIFELEESLGTAAGFVESLERAGVLSFEISAQRVRVVTHQDVSMVEVEQAAERIVELAKQAAES